MGNSGSTITGNQTATEKKPDAPTSCPVDHSAREVWLEAVRKNPSSLPESAPVIPSSSRPSNPHAEQEWLKWMKHNRTSSLTPPIKVTEPPPLNTSRVISTIPRADLSPATTTPDPNSLPTPSSPQAQNEKPGNWIYPSEKMFFEAMRRKNFSPHATDMSSIVPIHNAVNERAWHLIKEWESSSPRLRTLNEGCGGPKLRSFSGDASKLSPKARMMGWLGYQEPFDRHDWVVERCVEGKGVDYVIDFYKGRGEGVAFYLDVRPKLNSWEGWRMRVGRVVGFT